MTDRHADYKVDTIFVERWSPRSFTDDLISDDDLFAMFEAARWAPSSSNIQPWRFVYGKRGTPEFLTILAGLVEFNQGWADKAAALVVFMSEISVSRGGVQSVSTTHAFDTGAAWMSFALQAHRMGYVTHGMAGIYNDKLRGDLHVPDDIHIHAVVAVGKQGKPDTLPEGLRERESPSERRPVAESVMQGRF